MVDVVRTVSAATPVQTPAPVDFTNPKCFPMSSPSRFSVGDPFTSILGNLVPAMEGLGCETTLAVNARGFDC